jgi:hypothetical protein
MMFPEGTPEGELSERLREIERTPPDQRTPEESAQMEILEAWYVSTARFWGCRCYRDFWRQGYDWPRSAWTIAARDHAIKVYRAAQFGFVLARVPKERMICYRIDGLELALLTQAKGLIQG